MRIVDNKLNTTQWNVLNYLKENCVGKANALNGVVIATELGLTTEQFRYHIARIREHQDVIIGSSRKYGYYIPLREEYREAVKYQQNKALNSIRRNAKNDASFILKAYKILNDVAKSLDGVSQGQLRIQFNGWENEEENFFGDKYVNNK